MYIPQQTTPRVEVDTKNETIRNGEPTGTRAAGDGAAGREPERYQPVVNLASSGLGDIVDALALAPFSDGSQPWARSARLDRVRPEASLLPPGARLVREVVEKAREVRLAAGDGWTLQATRWTSGGGHVTVTAESADLARTVLDLATRDAAVEPPRNEDVAIGFWYHSPRRGPYRTTRDISAALWPEVRANYAADAAAALDRLMAVTDETVAGRLILLHGPPGTGKTTLLRTLARTWRDWCQVDCVLDPEALFHDPGYLMDVAVGFGDADPGDDEDGQPRRRRWRLLLLEDCDELISGEAKQSTGQALSRLLNLTDGLLGQGRDVLLAITTNEDIERLHPAVVRPGRCLAQIEVGPLPPAQAAAWLGDGHGEVRTATTLAELYARRLDRAPVEAQREAAGTGLYL